jgi:hypothetical protein
VLSSSSRGTPSGPTSYHPIKFPTKNISSPIVLLYGDIDSLVDIDVMVKELPSDNVFVNRLAVSFFCRHALRLTTNRDMSISTSFGARTLTRM